MRTVGRGLRRCPTTLMRAPLTPKDVLMPPDDRLIRNGPEPKLFRKRNPIFASQCIEPSARLLSAGLFFFDLLNSSIGVVLRTDPSALFGAYRSQAVVRRSEIFAVVDVLVLHDIALLVLGPVAAIGCPHGFLLGFLLGYHSVRDAVLKAIGIPHHHLAGDVDLLHVALLIA